MSQFWKPTVDMLSPIIQKPPLKPNFLQKPPFKFLFDVFSEVTKATNFAAGLYPGPQQSGDFHNQNKEKKIICLLKMFALLEATLKEQVMANPNKIVAGLQPENTNLMLQQLAKACKSYDPKKNQKICQKINANVASGQPPSSGLNEQEEKKQQKKQDPKKKQAQRKQNDRKQKQAKQRQAKLREQQEKQKKIKQQKLAKERQAKEKEERQRQARQAAQADKAEKQRVQRSRNRPPSASKGRGAPPAKSNQPKPQQQQPKQVAQRKPVKAQAQGIISKQGKEALQEPKSEQEKDDKIVLKRRNQGQKQKQGQLKLGSEVGAKQIDIVKQLFQVICQNAAPLSKNIQFISDDVDSMNSQFKQWRKLYNQAQEKRQNEVRITEEALGPLYNKLAEIDDKINEQKSKIQGCKAQIAKNQTIIQNLLYSVVMMK